MPKDLNDLAREGRLPADPMDLSEPANSKARRVASIEDAQKRRAAKEQRVAFPWLEAPAIFAPLPPVPYVLSALDVCPGAPTLVAGYGYSGKTIAMQSLGLAIACGLPAWGTYEVKQGRVVHIDYEQGERLTRERYQRLALGMTVSPGDIGDRLRLTSSPNIYLDGNVAEDVLTQELEGCTLAIVDSLRAAAPSIEENSSDVRKTLDMLGRVSSRTGCAVVVIHHARKPAKDAPGGAKMAIRGSGAIFDACSSVLVFEAGKGTPTRVSHEKARNSGQTVDEFQLTVADVPNGNDARWGVIVSAEAFPDESTTAKRDPAAEFDKLKERIREVFREHGTQSSKNAVRARLGADRNSVWAAFEELEANGEVVNLGTKQRPQLQLKQ
jgi:hypothetical protein